MLFFAVVGPAIHLHIIVRHRFTTKWWKEKNPPLIANLRSTSRTTNDIHLTFLYWKKCFFSSPRFLLVCCCFLTILFSHRFGEKKFPLLLVKKILYFTDCQCFQLRISSLRRNYLEWTKNRQFVVAALPSSLPLLFLLSSKAEGLLYYVLCRYIRYATKSSTYNSHSQIVFYIKIYIQKLTERKRNIEEKSEWIRNLL